MTTICEIMAFSGTAAVGDCPPATISFRFRRLELREKERDLAIVVGRFGRRAWIENALTDVASFEISRSEAISLARAMQKIVKKSWERLCVKTGFNALEIDRLRTCFIACDETIQGA